VIYKPSNLAFKTQGGVSASLTTMKNRNNEITKNTNSFRSPYGLSGANFGKYHGYSPYFIKIKPMFVIQIVPLQVNDVFYTI